MQKLLGKTIQLLLITLLGACSSSQAAPVPVTPTPSSGDEAKTLASLEQVDDYPLYTMTYYGEYASRTTSSLPAREEAEAKDPAWACSLFTVLLDDEHLLYGRNFDWEFSPALLLFTNPPDGYASVSMVDIAYLGFSAETVSSLTDLPLEEREGLLGAPLLPFDGMNEHGLAIGMAAVDPGGMQADPSKETIGSLGIIREILDHARDVDEAVGIMKKYNIDFRGGPPLHYLIADAKGKAVLVEFFRGEMIVMDNDQPWHFATNFLRSAVPDPQQGYCRRYDRIKSRMDEEQGLLDAASAMELLAEVAQNNTQWSVVYQMGRGEVSVVMGRDYANIQTFQTSDYFDPR
ncbi:MAG: C45 family peptidase [Anaerolineales bacterium]